MSSGTIALGTFLSLVSNLWLSTKWSLTFRSQVSLLLALLQSVLLAWTASKCAIPSPRLPPVDLSLSSLSTLTFTVCFLQLQTGTSTGSHLLMMLPASVAASSFTRRVRHSMPLSNTRLGQKSSRVKLSRRSEMTKVVSICLMSGSVLCLSMALS